jgi:hypothetical protein
MTETAQELVARLTGFTPGPHFASGQTVYAIHNEGAQKGTNKSAAYVNDPHTDYEELEANAELYAAATDLHRELSAAIARVELAEAYRDDLEVQMGKIILTLPMGKIRKLGPVDGVKMLRKNHDAALAREAALREALEWIKQNDETGPTLYEEYPEGSGRFREEGNAQGPFGVRARAALQVQP